VLTPAGSPITSISGLRGKTIAVNALKGLAELLTANVLASHGVPVSSVRFVAVPFPAMGAALSAHRVDAAFMTDPFLSAAEIGHGVAPAFDIDQGAAQDFPIAGYVVTRTWASRYPRTAAAFTAALTRGQQAAATSQAAVEEAMMGPCTSAKAPPG
jgi:NitT/TauT family transport system substrate-binding protein